MYRDSSITKLLASGLAGDYLFFLNMIVIFSFNLNRDAKA